MSVSKLESLPNEILTDILEKYINSIDIVNAFAFQLNRRFDALIIGSQRLRFNFIRCHKNDFRLCMGLLPAYIDKIEQLALAEQYTPGQVHAFLYFYPSFSLFKHLRKLYLQANVNSMEPRMLGDALRSLPTTSLHTLSLDISEAQKLVSLNNFIKEIFRMKTLKKLLISCDSYRMNWEALNGISSNIEYLTIHGIICNPANLEHIFRSTSILQYLNMDIDLRDYVYSTQPKLFSSDALPLMPLLHTVILNFKGRNDAQLKELEVYFQCMTSLQCLKIMIKTEISIISAWESLIQAMPSSLTSFTLDSTTVSLAEEGISNTLAITKKPCWTAKQQCKLIIKEVSPSHNLLFRHESSDNPDRDRWNETIALWCTGPVHRIGDSSSMVNGISKVLLSSRLPSILKNSYLNNVTHLVVDELNDELLGVLITHINCSRIKHLNLSSIKGENNFIFSLLSLVANIKSLRIYFNQLCYNISDNLRAYLSVQFLDISVDEHPFSEKDISMISRMFPHLEHLIIHTMDLQNIPMLQIYLPHLRTLTYIDIGSTRHYYYGDEIEMVESTIRVKSKFLFDHKGKYFTIWIDQEALQEPYWYR